MQPGKQPHVVMLVTNDVTGDSRVQKSALAVAEAGYRVTVLGYSPTKARTEEALGPATIVRIPSSLHVPQRGEGRSRGTRGR